MALKLKPIGLKEANTFVINWHRHHKKSRGYKFAIGIERESELVGVAICGRPNGIKYDTGYILEINRLCVKDGIKNGCSKLISAVSRVAKEMGYKKIITYTLMSEKGISLIASGWNLEAENVGGKEWNSSKKIKRSSSTTDLFGITKKYPSELKKRWSKEFI